MSPLGHHWHDSGPAAEPQGSVGQAGKGEEGQQDHWGKPILCVYISMYKYVYMYIYVYVGGERDVTNHSVR